MPRPARTKKTVGEAVRSSALIVLNIIITHFLYRAPTRLYLPLNRFGEHEQPRPRLRLKRNPNHHKPPILPEAKSCAEPAGHRTSLRNHLLPGRLVGGLHPRKIMRLQPRRRRNRVGQPPGGGLGTHPSLTRISPTPLRLSRNPPEGNVSRRLRRKTMTTLSHPRLPHTRGR